MEKMKIAVAGAAGRMGRELVRAIHARTDCVMTGALEQMGSLALGQDAGLLAGLGKLGVPITSDALELFAKVDAVLDFTAPQASVEFAALAANARIVHVLGTTGLGPEDEKKIAAAARHATIVTAGNMSLGVNLLAALTRKVAEALDADYDIEILEMHHRHKVDAPSGTALALGERVAAARGRRLEDLAVYTRQGRVGPRVPGTIGFSVSRGGNIVGEHTVRFIGAEEELSFTHEAQDRKMFARGALRAARWVAGRAPGLYSMADVLGLARS